MTSPLGTPYSAVVASAELMQVGQITISSTQMTWIAVSAATVGVLALAQRRATGPSRALLSALTVAATATAAIYWVGALSPDIERAVSVLKAFMAVTAASCVFIEIDRAQKRRPIAERWKKFVGITLGVGSIILYFNGFHVGYEKFWHRHDQYHYYLGAKYFRELGYDGLYKCTVVALDELGKVTETVDGRTYTLDLDAEVRAKDKKIRNLGGDNLLMPASVALERPEECKARFSTERWGEFKQDIKFFRFSCAAPNDKSYWDGMQKDHGYNPPPVWTLTGYLISSAHEATEGFMQVLGAIDEGYLLAMFVGIYWAFGWRIFAVAAIFWGCQASAPNLWSLGAFLRQDWLFWFVMAACFSRKRYFKLAGASMVYASLLRVFPVLTILGWVVVAGAYLWKHRRMKRDHAEMLLGGVIAAVVLVGASLAVAGRDSYQQFYKHTLVVHDQTPLTNHMGLRVLIGHRIECIIPQFPGCAEKASGRMKFVKDESLRDPFEKWKEMRLERYARYRPLAYGIIALTFVLFVAVVRRIKSMWLAQALAQIWIILLSQLTNYYYAFAIIAAPITRVRRDLEVWLFGFAALTQFISLPLGYFDDRYAMLTLANLIFCYCLILSLAPKGWFVRWTNKAAHEKIASHAE